MDEKLEIMNQVMAEFNKSFDEIRKKKYEWDSKRMHDRDAHLIYEGLEFAYIEMCNLQGRLDNIVTN